MTENRFSTELSCELFLSDNKSITVVQGQNPIIWWKQIPAVENATATDGFMKMCQCLKAAG